MTLTGTDHLAQAVEEIEAEIYIDVQGDEPLLKPADILKVRDEKLKHGDDIINCFSWIESDEDPRSVNIPKVVTTESGKLVYMSRRLLPGYKDPRNAPARYKKQVCIYAFTREELRSFRRYGRKSHLEQCEDIEVLRFLELGKSIRLVETSAGSIAVDVPDDVMRVEAALKELGEK